MLTIFNRWELLITFQLDEQVRVRNLLSIHNIEYRVTTENPSARATSAGTRRGRAGGLGVNSDAAYEYKIYVHRKDYQRAKALL